MNQRADTRLSGLEPSLLLELEAHATKLARKAGALLLDSFHQDLQVEYKSKGHRDPVTEADRRAEALLIDEITTRFPDHGIISEESPQTIGADRDILWILDPLDGTTNFVNRYPFFGVSVGVLYKGIPVAAALFVPSPVVAQGQVLHARLEGGAFIDDATLSISGKEDLSPAGLLTMPAYFWRQFRIGRDLAQRIGDVRTTGSTVYEMALAASGVFQFAAFGPQKIWDVAAGILIIREAGGEALVRRVKPRRWEPFRSFLEPGGGLSRDGDLREWSAGLLVGNPSIVDLVARSLRPRPRLLRWMSRLRYRWGATSRATERHDDAPEQGKPDAPEAPPPDIEGPPPPETPAKE